MDCIFICVFYQEKYVEMFYLLLESIIKYAQLSSSCDIVLYTTSAFMELIKQHELFIPKIKFEINNDYNTISSACKARLDCFSLPSIANYSRILYLDTDIIVKGPISKVFEVCDKDLLYVLEEGNLHLHDDYYGGKSLFGAEINNYADKTAFTSGILLFRNCEKLSWLFKKIKEDIVERPVTLGCHDQPYIVYSAFKYSAFDNKLLKEFIVNNDYNIMADKIIHHFPGGPGIYAHKIAIMTNFLQRLQT